MTNRLVTEKLIKRIAKSMINSEDTFISGSPKMQTHKITYQISVKKIQKSD